MARRIYTKTGDLGETSLFGGQRVKKSHARVAAYGAVDELVAALGLCRALGAPSEIDAALCELQVLLMELASVLATPPERGKQPAMLKDADVAQLERAIDAAEAELDPLKSFILPGGSQAAAALHVARTVCRRAERCVVALRDHEPKTPDLAVTILNRMSDLLFVLARRANQLLGVQDVPWRARTRSVEQTD